VPGLLLVSLAANLFLVGILAGQFTHSRVDSIPTYSIRSFLAVVPEEAQETVRAAFAGREAEIAAARGDARGARGAVAEAFVAEPFDRAAAEAAFQRLRQESDDLQSAVQAAIMDAAARMPVATRQEILERARARRAAREAERRQGK